MCVAEIHSFPHCWTASLLRTHHSFPIISLVNRYSCHSQFLATVSRAARNLLVRVPSARESGGGCWWYVCPRVNRCSYSRCIFSFCGQLFSKEIATWGLFHVSFQKQSVETGKGSERPGFVQQCCRWRCVPPKRYAEVLPLGTCQCGLLWK